MAMHMAICMAIDIAHVHASGGFRGLSYGDLVIMIGASGVGTYIGLRTSGALGLRGTCMHARVYVRVSISITNIDHSQSNSMTCTLSNAFILAIVTFEFAIYISRLIYIDIDTYVYAIVRICIYARVRFGFW